MKGKLIKRYISLNTLLIIFISINAQSVISEKETTKREYWYDESAYLSMFKNSEIEQKDIVLNKIRDKLDSIAKSLDLGLKDAIVVYRNIAEIRKGELIGLYKLDGSEIFKPKYRYLTNIYPSELWKIKIDGKYGILNPHSMDMLLIKPKYKFIRLEATDTSQSNYLNRYLVQLDSLYGVIDTMEQEITPIEYSELNIRDPKLYLAKKEGKYGFIRPSGKIVIPFIYDDCWHFYTNNLAPVRFGKKWGLINQENKLVVDTIYDNMFCFQKDILRVRLNKKYGFLNTEGKVIIDCKYDDADAYSKNGVIRVKVRDKYAIVNKNGKELCGFKYDRMGKFYQGCTVVMINEKMGVLNNKGKEIIPVKFDKIEIWREVIVIYQDGKKTFYDFKGKKVTY